MVATLSGAFGSSTYTLDFQGKSVAYQMAKSLIPILDSEYSSAVLYDPNNKVPHAGALIVGDAVYSNIIKTGGFGAIVVENNGIAGIDTLWGAGNQAILAGDSGIAFWSKTGNDTIIAGGGNNAIYLGADGGSSQIYTGNGNDTIHTSNGNVSVDAGAGMNHIWLGDGADRETVSGNDTIHLGGGYDTITVVGNGSAVVHGAATAVGGYTLTFIGGSNSSTVMAGAGSYSINGGAGGGVFYGGANGYNSIVAGTGAATIYGAGYGDTLLGGAGNDLIVAATGNETLGGGAGVNVFNFTKAVDSNYTITDFGAAGSTDVMQITRDQGSFAYVLNHYQVTAGGDLVHLRDGTTILLQGYTAALTASDFKH